MGMSVAESGLHRQRAKKFFCASTTALLPARLLLQHAFFGGPLHDQQAPVFSQVKPSAVQRLRGHFCTGWLLLPCHFVANAAVKALL